MEFEQILSLIQAVSDSHLSQFSLEQGDLKIAMKTDRGGKQSSVVQLAAPLVQAEGEPDGIKDAQEEKKEEVISSGHVVKAPLVGTFYSSASPESEPFIQVGDVVKPGQVLGIVEAMKLMNEIESDYAGTVTQILVENEQVVEYGQPLFVIE